MDRNKSDMLLTILQLTDTVYPTGGFSHSLGFEAANKFKLINNKESYRNFITACLENAGSLLLPFVRESHSSYDNVQKLVVFDEVCQSCLYNHVANRASIRQGRSLIETASKTYGGNDGIAMLQSLGTDGQVRGHHSVMFGALCAILGIDLQSTLTMFLYNSLKTVVTSSVRLGVTGTLEAQGIQHQLQKQIPDIIDRNSNLDIEDVHVSFPVVDIVQNVHDTLFSKLFYS